MMQPIIEIRLAMVACGYTPIPVIGKIPPLEKWQQTTAVSRQMLENWASDWPTANNTGILTQLTPTLDLDLLNEPAAIAIETMVRQRFDGLGSVLTRIGRAPKRAILFRTTAPFKKLSTNFLVRPGATSERIEFLGEGQQVVAHGIHPDTQGPYTWIGGDPTTIAYTDLPEITVDGARALRDDIVAMLVRDFGYVTTQGAPKKTSTTRAKTARKNPKRDLAWAETALEAECALISNAAIGERNNQLNMSAYNIYQIVHGNPGILDESEVRRRLFAAAEACGLVDDDGADAAWRTIESGEAGAVKQPRVRPLAKLDQPAPGGPRMGLGLAGAASGFRDGMPEQVVVKRPVSSITVRVVESGYDCDGNRMPFSDAAQIEYRSPSESETPAQPVQEILPPEPEPEFETIDEAIAPEPQPVFKNEFERMRARAIDDIRSGKSIDMTSLDPLARRRSW
jgi:hypothetical protein